MTGSTCSCECRNDGSPGRVSPRRPLLHRLRQSTERSSVQETADRKDPPEVSAPTLPLSASTTTFVPSASSQIVEIHNEDRISVEEEVEDRLGEPETHSEPTSSFPSTESVPLEVGGTPASTGPSLLDDCLSALTSRESQSRLSHSKADQKSSADGAISLSAASSRRHTLETLSPENRIFKRYGSPESLGTQYPASSTSCNPTSSESCNSDENVQEFEKTGSTVIVAVRDLSKQCKDSQNIKTASDESTNKEEADDEMANDVKKGINMTEKRDDTPGKDLSTSYATVCSTNVTPDNGRNRGSSTYLEKRKPIASTPVQGLDAGVDMHCSRRSSTSGLHMSPSTGAIRKYSSSSVMVAQEFSPPVTPIEAVNAVKVTDSSSKNSPRRAARQKKRSQEGRKEDLSSSPRVNHSSSSEDEADIKTKTITSYKKVSRKISFSQDSSSSLPGSNKREDGAKPKSKGAESDLPGMSSFDSRSSFEMSIAACNRACDETMRFKREMESFLEERISRTVENEIIPEDLAQLIKRYLAKYVKEIEKLCHHKMNGECQNLDESLSECRNTVNSFKLKLEDAVNRKIWYFVDKYANGYFDQFAILDAGLRAIIAAQEQERSLHAQENS